MQYKVDCQRRGADADSLTLTFEDVYQAKASFDHQVSMAIQHGEWHAVQLRGVRAVYPFAAYDCAGLPVESLH